MTPEAASSTVGAPPSASRVSLTWLLALGPLVLLGVLLALLIGTGPSRLIAGEGYPPVERLAFLRVELVPDAIVVSVLNDGPDPVTIAQVMVDDAFWTFNVEPGSTLAHLGRARLVIPYPWVRGEAHVVRLLTSTGITFDHTIGVAVETPRPTMRFLGVFALIGLYVGVLPVALGLLWYPLIGRLGRRGLDFLLALTIGLLAFLFVDGGHDGLEAAARVPGSYQGVMVLLFGVLAAWLALDALGAWLSARRRERASRSRPGGAVGGTGQGWVLALLVAIGIGLHNFGEGLAIGSAFSLGEMALGSLLIVGFTLHNTTEGLAIVAPLARDRANEASGAPIGQLLQLGLIGGAPTIVGAWIGGFVYSPIWSVLMLGLGVGAIGQVTRQILRQTTGDRELGRYFKEAPVLTGLATGFAVMYVTGMFVG